jgi:predicted cupin superfamily sugar epimerase
MDEKPNAGQVIEWLHLEPLLVEGGYYRQSYRSTGWIPPADLPDRLSTPKVFSTAIYYLRTSDPDSFSAMHRLLVDEIHHFYLGDPVEMLLLYPDGEGQILTMGPAIRGGHRLQVVVPQGVWQGGRVIAGGQWALTGATCAPGFDEIDYEGADRGALIEQYPLFANQIASLTRPDSPRRMA